MDPLERDEVIWFDSTVESTERGFWEDADEGEGREVVRAAAERAGLLAEMEMD